MRKLEWSTVFCRGCVDEAHDWVKRTNVRLKSVNHG